MTLFEYVSLMQENGSPVGLVGVALVGVFLLAIIINMLIGMGRGTWRQLLRVGLTFSAAAVSYIAAEFLSNSVIGAIKVEKIEELIDVIDSKMPGIGDSLNEALANFDPELIETLFVLPATIIIMPVIATAIFLIINLILRIVGAVLNKVFDFKKSKTNPQRLGGAALGAVEAIIWTIMVTLPISGIFGMLHNLNDELDTGDETSTSEFETVYSDYFEPLAENPAFTFINAMGGEALSNGIATVKINGNRVNMRHETVFVAKVVIEETPNLSEIDFSAPSENDKTAINNLINGLCDSSYVSSIIVNVLHGSSNLLNLTDLMGPDANQDMVALINDFIGFLDSVSMESLSTDIATIKTLYFELADSGILAEMKNGNGDILGIIQEKHKSGDDIVTKLIRVLQSNERTKPLVKSITKAIISSISTSVDLGNGVTVNVSYDSLKEGITDVLSVKPENYETEDEYKEALTETLDTVLTDHGIELEDEAVEVVVDYIDKAGLSADDFTDDNFTDILLECYGAFISYTSPDGEGGGNLPDSLPEGFPDNVTDFFPGGDK